MTNILPAAHVAQAMASVSARVGECYTLPLPPAGYPALRSIAGPDRLSSAAVLGYVVAREAIRDCYAPDGFIRRPGDPGYLDAQYGRLGFAPMPQGWCFVERETAVFYALVDGNPTLLEEQARSIGYPRALASAPQWLLCLGEITPVD